MFEFNPQTRTITDKRTGADVAHVLRHNDGSLNVVLCVVQWKESDLARFAEYVTDIEYGRARRYTQDEISKALWEWLAHKSSKPMSLKERELAMEMVEDLAGKLAGKTIPEIELQIPRKAYGFTRMLPHWHLGLED